MEKKSLQIYNTLEKKSFTDLYRIYYETKRNFLIKKDKKSLYFLKMIEKIVDTKDLDESEKKIIFSSYNSYPDYNDPDFNSEITKKAEFFHCKSLLDLIELDSKCYPSNFELGNHQKFLKNFMNKNTPYKGLLVFHGVGVGKTCTAVTISNSFIDIYKNEDKKIICLVSKNIQSNWMNTIYDPEKGDNQCNGENFQSIIHTIDMKVNTSFRVKKLIRDYYEFYGYQQFSNKVKKLIDLKMSTSLNKTLEEVEKDVIKKYFSNRLLIIDEIHNLRDDNLDKFSKDTIKFLDKVIKYSDNLRLLLLSATPMFNKATEIQWLLNLLLKNDKRPTISKYDIFDENEKLKESGIEFLKKKSRGYVSYVRGENPITFPIRLYPSDNNDTLTIDGVNIKYPEKDMDGIKYDDSIHRFKFLKMYYNQMDSFQKDIYEKYVSSLPSKNLQISEQRFGVQISNIVYPTVDILSGEKEITDTNFKNMYGGSGLFKSDVGIMKQSKSNTFRYSNNYRKKIDKPIFDLENISVISSKIHNILKGLQVSKSKGIIFIYSEFIPSGVLPLAFALEHMGFEKYSGNILDYPEWKKDSKPTSTKNEPIDYEWTPISKKKKGSPFKRAKYVILSGNKNISPNNNEEIKQLVSGKNINGENIKIVIGTVVASEGLDLKNVREIHILDPWYHLSRIEQIIGRGIRFCSHLKLPQEERNVTVYIHVSGTDKENENIDTYTYRKAEEKAIVIGKIENILKENAIDCHLNKQINYIQKTQLNPVDLLSSRNKKIKNHPLHDKKYSKVCSFSECDYSCDCDNMITDKDINYDTFTLNNSKDLFIQVKKVIFELFELSPVYTLEELNDSILKTIDTNKTVIFYTLFDMIDNKISLWNQNNISGYLINKNEYYIFQPHNNTDEMLPLYYRLNSLEKNSTQYLPLEDKLFESKKKEEKIYYFNSVYKKIIQSLIKEDDFFKDYDFNNYINKLKFEIYRDYVYDCLSYQEKIVLLKDIIKEFIDTGSIKEDEKRNIFEYFFNNLIYEENQNYYIIEKKRNIKGFFVFNTDKFLDKKVNKLKEIDQIDKDYEYFIYKNDQFYNTKELDDGELIENSIRENFISIKDKTPVLKTEKLWGYPFKTEGNNIMFKLVDENMKSHNKLPGRIVSQIAKKNSVRAFIRIYFKENYDLLINDDPDIENQTKNYLYMLIEMIIRNREKNKKGTKYSFLKYDIIFLKFFE
jgi:superfamily II DNA or RNA helicase